MDNFIGDMHSVSNLIKTNIVVVPLNCNLY